jgi:hypothetical protein
MHVHDLSIAHLNQIFVILCTPPASQIPLAIQIAASARPPSSKRQVFESSTLPIV